MTLPDRVALPYRVGRPLSGAIGILVKWTNVQLARMVRHRGKIKCLSANAK